LLLRRILGREEVRRLLLILFLAVCAYEASALYAARAEAGSCSDGRPRC
jgi:hypothetical protein